MKPKLVILTSRFPYPLEKGDKLRAYHQIRTLRTHFDIFLITIADYTVSKAEMDRILPIVKELHVIKISPLQRIVNVLSTLFGIKPFQVAFFEDKNAARYIKNIISEIEPYHIYCQLARIAPYVSHMPYPKTLDYMDAFGIGMLRRSKVSGWFFRWIYTLEAKRMIRFEKDVYHTFDHHTVISAQDCKELQSGNKNKLHVIPNGIDTEFFKTARTDKKFDLVFVGNMGYLPNIEAAEFIAHKILPLCPQDVKVLIAGARPHKRVLKLESEKLKVSGWIDKITEAYESGKIFVAPIWSGTGQQNKILEAMAMGLPCITTNIVNNAIHANPGMELFTAESAQDFADLIKILLENDTLRSESGTAGRRFVKQKYSWEHYSQVLSDIFAGKIN